MSKAFYSAYAQKNVLGGVTYYSLHLYSMHQHTSENGRNQVREYIVTANKI